MLKDKLAVNYDYIKKYQGKVKKKLKEKRIRRKQIVRESVKEKIFCSKIR